MLTGGHHDDGYSSGGRDLPRIIDFDEEKNTVRVL